MALTSARTLVALALLLTGAKAQVFTFDNMPVPAAYTLSTHYMFYVFSGEEVPGSKHTSATVEFRRLESRSTGSKEVPAKYDSVEVSILPFDSFWTLIDEDRFCSTSDDVRMKRAEKSGKLMTTMRPPAAKEMGVRTVSAPFPIKGVDGPKMEAVSLKATGRYILTFTNCGNFSDAVVNGALAVKNAYGYLPGNEYYTMQLFGVVTLIYVCICVVWFIGMVRHFKVLFYIQKGIAAIAFLCAVQNLMAWLEYQDWNTTGERHDILFVSSLLFYTMKYVLAWRLILLASLGAGVVLEDLDGKTSVMFFLSSTLFMIQSCVWKILMSFRFSHELDSNFLLMVTIPGMLIYGGMFVWTFMELSKLLTRLSDQQQELLISVFSKCRIVLLGGLALAVVISLVQLADIAKGGMFAWQFQWVCVDGAPQFAFMTVLMLMMKVWWPSEDSWKFGYMVQVDEEEGVKGSIVAPEPIGAAED